jgi:hypothetical protein
MKFFPIALRRFTMKPFHIILVILAILLLSKLGFGVKEYFENQGTSSSSLPNGIPYNEIPPGDEDLYIKKSEVVPPVCPKCPDVTACPSMKEKCPPCPACARCPEPAYQCKLVPNYDSLDNDVVPRPVLTDFSNFGI